MLGILPNWNGMNDVKPAENNSLEIDDRGIGICNY